MARPYIFNFSGIVPTALVPFLQLATPATTTIKVTELCIGPESGAATSTSATLVAARRTTASTLPTAAVASAAGTNQSGTSGVISPISERDPATTLTLGTTATAVGVATTTGTLNAYTWRWPFNLAAGWFWSPIPDNQNGIQPSTFWTLQFVATQTASFSGYIVYEESP